MNLGIEIDKIYMGKKTQYIYCSFVERWYQFVVSSVYECE